MKNNLLDLKSDSLLLTLRKASVWASEYLGKNVTSGNILYLLNYGKIANHSMNAKENLIDKSELKAYYDSTIKNQAYLDSPLSFSQYKESQTTKHIHKLHPYKGKFIPQLVEYFLNSQTDSLKLETYFKQGDIVLDLFCGSGTTLAVANELNMHALGIDVSAFNTKLSNAKIKKYDIETLECVLNEMLKDLEAYLKTTKITEFEKNLNTKLSEFNKSYFPNKEFKRQVVLGNIDEKIYGELNSRKFLEIYNECIKQYDINLSIASDGNFLDRWYLDSIKQEILLLKDKIKTAPRDLQDILMVILSRTARSCRATTHSDLATLIKPIRTSYYCSKHGRICKPLFSILKWFKSYSKDTIKRLKEFDRLRTDTRQICLNGDSQNIDLYSALFKIDSEFATLVTKQKIAGIFSSPPYVGLIDYHEQHAYSYDIFNLPRKDNLEIGKMSDGQNISAREKYIQNIANALKNAKGFLRDNYDVFLVANDKFSLYPKIAELANMEIIKTYNRPVINRSEKDKNKYSESIFHLKEK